MFLVVVAVRAFAVKRRMALLGEVGSARAKGRGERGIVTFHSEPRFVGTCGTIDCSRRRFSLQSDKHGTGIFFSTWETFEWRGHWAFGNRVSVLGAVTCRASLQGG